MTLSHSPANPGAPLTLPDLEAVWARQQTLHAAALGWCQNLAAGLLSDSDLQQASNSVQAALDATLNLRKQVRAYVGGGTEEDSPTSASQLPQTSEKRVSPEVLARAAQLEPLLQSSLQALQQAMDHAIASVQAEKEHVANLLGSTFPRTGGNPYAFVAGLE